MNYKNDGFFRTFFYTAILTASCSFSHAQDDSLSSVPTAAPDLVGQAAQHVALVDDMATEFGPYDLRLTEPLLAAADLQAEAGLFTQALEGYQQALQITRINTGLYSEQQIPLVERIIDCHVSLADWPHVDEQFRYLQLLYSRVYEPGSEGWARGIAQISDWHVLVINHGLATDRQDHLKEAHELLTQRLEFSQTMPGVDERVLEVLRRNVELTTHYMRLAARRSAQEAFDGARLSLVDQVAWTN
jgi:tetratricopeptide (TPR) repeat protein